MPGRALAASPQSCGNSERYRQAKERSRPEHYTRAEAEALLAERWLRTEPSETEIKQLADYFYAHELNADEEQRQEGSASDAATSSSFGMS